MKDRSNKALPIRSAQLNGTNKRANETNDNTMPDRKILAILYEEISRDPREALGITALNCQEQQLSLEEVLTRLLASAGANRTVPC